MKPIFKNILQAGFVVSDVFKPLRYFYNNFGIGPWSIYKFDPEVIEDMIVEGKPKDYKALIAIIKLGGFGLEYIVPLDESSVYWNFLNSHGEGLQHLAYHTDSYDKVLDFFINQKGLPVYQSGSWFGRHVSTYFDIKRLKHVIEIYRPDSSFSKYETDKYGITHRTNPVPDRLYPPIVSLDKRPLLKKVLSVGLVVKDLRATKAVYEEEFGIVGWKDIKIIDDSSKEVLASRCRIGDIFIELIQPDYKDDNTIFGRSLRSRGEGLHNIGYVPYDLKETIKTLEKLSSSDMETESRSIRSKGQHGIYFDLSKDLNHAIKIYDPDFLNQYQGD